MKFNLKHKSILFFKEISRKEIILQAAFTGFLTGFLVLAFNSSINYLFSFSQNYFQHLSFFEKILIIPLVTTIGGLISGLLVFKIAPETKGSGIPYVKLVLSRLGKGIRIRSLFVKFFAGIAAIGSGMSLGKEGPSVQMGAGVGALVSKLFKLKGTSQYNLITAGAASALGATFNTPVSGMIFAVEELTQKFSVSILFPVMISISISVSIIRFFCGDYPTFSVPILSKSTVFTWHSIFIYIVLGILTGFLGVLFSKNIFLNLKIFSYLPKVKNIFKPALAGLIVGIIGVIVPEIMGTGANIVEKLVNGQFTISFIIILFILKFIATSFCFGSGAAGGIFLPTLVLGSLIGGFVGLISLKMGIDINLGAICVIGMGAFLASVVRSPITAVMMVFEMTGDYKNILPVILTVAISDLIAENLHHSPIYTTLILKQNMYTDYAKKLSNIKVCSICSRTTEILTLNDKISDIYQYMFVNKIRVLPVKNQDNSLAGSVSFADLEDYKIRGNDMELNVQTVMNTEPLTIYQNADLYEASFKMHVNEVEYMIVISRNKKIIGILHHQDILNQCA
jgi:CIC family chloride channel protein